MIEWPDVLEYVSLVMNTSYPYHSQPDLQELIYSMVAKVNQRPAHILREGVRLGNLEDMLELAMRSYAACEIAKGEFSPYILLDNIKDNTPREVAARIFSFLAHVYFESRYSTGKPGGDNIDAIYRGANMANKAAALGFVSPVVLLIANFVENMGCRQRAQCPYEEYRDVERFEKLEDLWRAHDERKLELGRSDEARERRMQRQPHGYVCAARDCDIQGTRSTGLQRCGGKCSREWKPAYCSKECQRKDWIRHRPFCRPGGAVDKWVVSLRASPNVTESIPTVPLSTTPNPPSVKKRSKEAELQRYERRIEAVKPSGQSVQFSSSTMGPSLMKGLKATLQKDSAVV